MPSLASRDIPEPRPGTKPQETSSPHMLVILLSVIAMALLFIIYRRASAWKSVVQHRLKSLTSHDGAIRLPDEDGPPAEIFNEDEELDSEDEPLPRGQDLPLKGPPINLSISS